MDIKYTDYFNKYLAQLLMGGSTYDMYYVLGDGDEPSDIDNTHKLTNEVARYEIMADDISYVNSDYSLSDVPTNIIKISTTHIPEGVEKLTEYGILLDTDKGDKVIVYNHHPEIKLIKGTIYKKNMYLEI